MEAGSALNQNPGVQSGASFQQDQDLKKMQIRETEQDLMASRVI